VDQKTKSEILTVKNSDFRISSLIFIANLLSYKQKPIERDSGFEQLTFTQDTNQKPTLITYNNSYCNEAQVSNQKISQMANYGTELFPNKHDNYRIYNAQGH
jgi:hypothetical protein